MFLNIVFSALRFERVRLAKLKSEGFVMSEEDQSFTILLGTFVLPIANVASDAIWRRRGRIPCLILLMVLMNYLHVFSLSMTIALRRKNNTLHKPRFYFYMGIYWTSQFPTDTQSQNAISLCRNCVSLHVEQFRGWYVTQTAYRWANIIYHGDLNRFCLCFSPISIFYLLIATSVENAASFPKETIDLFISGIWNDAIFLLFSALSGLHKIAMFHVSLEQRHLETIVLFVFVLLFFRTKTS